MSAPWQRMLPRGPASLARSLVEPLTRAFYAMHDTRTPLQVSVVAVGVNIVLSWFLLESMGFPGLALALTLSYTARMTVLFALLERRTGRLLASLARPVGRMLPAALALLLAGLALAGPVAAVTDPADGGRLWGYPLFVLALAALASVYVITAWACRVPEVTDVLAKVRTRLGRGRTLV